MSKAAAHEPELFGAAPAKPKQQRRPAPLAEGSKKGGRNQVTQVTERPAAPKAMVVHQPQPPAAPKSLLEVCLWAAKQPDVAPDRLRAFLDMAHDEERRKAEAEFNDALAAAKKNMPAVVGPDRTNDHTKSNYATLEKVSKTMDKAIAAQGFTISYGMAESSLADHYRITARLSRGGFSRDYFIDLPADSKGAKGGDTKTLVQGIGSTISYARRYIKLMMFDLVVGREDDDGQGGNADKITEEQADELLRMCADKNIGADLFSKAFGVTSFADLPARRFEEAKSRLTLAPAQQAKPKQQEQNHEAE